MGAESALVIHRRANNRCSNRSGSIFRDSLATVTDNREGGGAGAGERAGRETSLSSLAQKVDLDARGL